MTLDATRRRALLDRMVNALAAGDSALGEALLAEALDAGVPWDEATAAAARGVSRRYGRPERTETAA
jgi:hypothetical protein